MFRSITFVLSAILLGGCFKPSTDSIATCRTDVWAQSDTLMPYACVLRFGDKVLLHKEQGKHQLVNHVGQDVCAAHHGLFLTTGWNAKLTGLGQVTPSQTQLLTCTLDNVINTDNFPRTTSTGLALVLIDPFTLSHKDMHEPDDLIALKDTFLQTTHSIPIQVNSN